MKNPHTDTSRKARTRWGIALLVTGGVFLLILALSFLMTRGMLSLPEWGGWRQTTPVEVPERERPQIEVPHATSSSELKDYYENNPRDKVLPRETAEEEDDYYTRPDGSAWVKDKSNENILGDTKKGEGNFQEKEQAKAEAVTNRPLHVEFWESPVNFKGYKMNGNNVILYGISPDDSLRFERRKDGVWMYHFNENAVYLLVPTTDDKPFNRINSEPGLEVKTVN
ncbi:MAG: hypothetical protein K2M92_04310 [Bacteroidales bacterium]|nr:hypothetical protein [Bacteroidales bacterium]